MQKSNGGYFDLAGDSDRWQNPSDVTRAGFKSPDDAPELVPLQEREDFGDVETDENVREAPHCNGTMCQWEDECDCDCMECMSIRHE